MELPFAPSWLPTWVIVMNTLILEVLLAVAFHRFVIRRSPNPRRSHRRFVVGTALAAVLQVVVLLDISLAPRPNNGRYWRSVSGLGNGASGKLTFGWSVSPILRRRVRPVVSLWVPQLGRSSIFVSTNDGIHYYGSGWTIENTVLVHALFQFVDAEETPEMRTALWRAVSSSRLAATHSEVAAIASDA